MYSSSLCSHVNNIYSKLSELQRQIQHHCMHMNQSDTVQIEAPNFDPDIEKKPNEIMYRGHYHSFLKLPSLRMIIVLPLEQLHNS